MGFFDIFKKKKKVEETVRVEPDSEIFQKVYDIISYYLPESWGRLAIYYAVVDNIVDFKYYLDEGKGYVDCFNLKDYSKEKFRDLRFAIDDVLLEDRKHLPQDKQWSVFTMFISSSGKFETNFSYEDISETFHQYHEKWEKENLDSNYIVEIISSLPKMLPLKPATEKQISDAENQLGLKFANEYKEYLAKFGAIMADGIELSGIAKSKHRNVVFLTQQEWGLNPTVPHNMYVVENVGIDGMIIWQSEKGEIYQSTPNTEPAKIANSLAEYISAR